MKKNFAWLPKKVGNTRTELTRDAQDKKNVQKIIIYELNFKEK